MRDSQVTTTVRVPIATLAASIRTEHSIPQELAAASIEGDALVLTFGARIAKAPASGGAPPDHPLEEPPSATSSSGSSHSAPLRRRSHSRRNRMKTRGWNIVTKMVNSKGQTVAIYEPFVQALRGKHLRKREQAKLVAQVLKENGNNPGPVSVDYYLSNTLEYLAKEASR